MQAISLKEIQNEQKEQKGQKESAKVKLPVAKPTGKKVVLNPSTLLPLDVTPPKRTWNPVPVKNVQPIVLSRPEPKPAQPPHPAQPAKNQKPAKNQPVKAGASQTLESEGGWRTSGVDRSQEIELLLQQAGSTLNEVRKPVIKEASVLNFDKFPTLDSAIKTKKGKK